MSIFPSKDIVLFEEIEKKTMTITIDDWSFTIPGSDVTSMTIIHFGDNYVILQHLATVIVIDRIKKQYVAINISVIFVDSVYYNGNNIILTYYNSMDQMYSYEIYDLSIKMLAKGKSNMLGIFNYKDKILCITNEKIFAEVSVDENNNLEFNVINDIDYVNEIEDSIYTVEYGGGCHNAIKINLSTISTKLISHRIFIKICNKHNIYYRNGLIRQAGIQCRWTQMQYVNYITDDFYCAYDSYFNPTYVTYTKHFINSDNQQIITIMPPELSFACRNEYVPRSQLKFSD